MQTLPPGDILSGGDQASRRLAAEQLSQDADAAAAHAVLLVRHAGDDDRVVAEYCVAALEELGPPPPDQVTPLADLATSSSADVAYWAATLLGRAGTAAAGQATRLAAIVASDAPPHVRQRAAWAIAQMGPAGAAAAAQLRQAAGDQPPNVARAIAKALQSIGG